MSTKMNERLAALEAQHGVADDDVDVDDMMELYTLFTTVLVCKLERSEERQARFLIEQGFDEAVARRFAGMSYNAARDEVDAFIPVHNCPPEEMKDALKRLRAAVLKGFKF